VKPGNRVEEKTLTTEPQRRESLEAVQRRGVRWSVGHGGTRNPPRNRKGAERKLSTYRHPTVDPSDRCGNKMTLTTGKTRTSRPRYLGVGSRGREARMTTLESRYREGSEQPENGMGMARSKRTPRRRLAEVMSHSGWGQDDPPFPTISNARGSRRMTR